jgi:hypothetical protein
MSGVASTACSSRPAWARALLTAMGDPLTQPNEVAIDAWALKEDGGGSHARFNNLNTTMPASGATNYNSVHVKNYTSCQQGLDKTVATLKLKPYGDIRTALANGSGDIGHAGSLHTWGTQNVPQSYFNQATKEISQ